jgi:uncharacterized protein
MIRVVLDTNVIVSAALTPEGAEAAVLVLCLNQRLQMCVSDAVLAEYEDVLSRPKFRRSAVFVQRLMSSIRDSSQQVRPTQTVAVSPDEQDNRVLECAEAADADYLVTGNKRHFPNTWKRTEIVNARRIIAKIAPEP